MTWVDELVAVGEMISFANYENYGGEWRVADIDKVDTYNNCKAKFGKDEWFLRKINRTEEK